jgi:U3 small nucleolar RNA-associated protein 15
MAHADHDGTYLKLPVKRYAPRTIRETAEGRYWRSYKSEGLLNQVSQVTHVAFGETYPHHLAVTSSARVTVYNSQSRRPVKTFQRFKDVAYSGVLREDGKALAVGGQQGWVQVFDTASRAVLRKFTLHTRPARAVRFSPHSHSIMCSASDDTTVRIWDIAAGACVTRHDGHTDYARAIAGHPSSSTTWASGSYDGTVKLWDSRVNGGKGGCGMTLKHGAPVEYVVWLPGGQMLVSVGGQDVCVWDALSGGKLVSKIRCHQKTVMCCHVAPDGGPVPVADDDRAGDGDLFSGFVGRNRSAMNRTSPRLLTGSLDGHVKVFELDSFSVTHGAKYPGPVLSVALSPCANVLAVGTANRLLSIRRRSKPRQERDGDGDGTAGGDGRGLKNNGGGGGQKKTGPRRLDAGSYQYFIRGQNATAAAGDAKIEQRRRVRLAQHDHALRRFRYAEALDSALRGGRAEVVAAVFEEIGRRGGLKTALTGRDANSLEPVLNFCATHVIKPRHTQQLCGVIARVLDIYGSEIGASTKIDSALRKIRRKVGNQLKTQQRLARLEGIAAPILAAGR